MGDVSESEQGGSPDLEIQILIPQDGKIATATAESPQREVESLNKLKGESGYNPFAERASPMKNRTTDAETLIHLLKAIVGTGILGMPYAFMNAGLLVGLIGTVLISVICTHCAYSLVKCAHELYYRYHICELSFGGIGEMAFINGPQPIRKYAKACKIMIMVMLFLTYFGSLCVYTVIVGNSFQQVIESYTGVYLEQRIYIAALLIPLLLLGFTPNLKMLTSVSLIANILMLLGLGITAYYLLQDQSAVSERPLTAPIGGLPQFFSITVFAMETIGVMMPLENSMKNPPHFLRIWSLCGVLNIGMTIVTILYAGIGLAGFVRYGECTYGAVTLNLGTEEWLGQAVKILVASAVFCTYGLPFFVCLEILQDLRKDNSKSSQFFGDKGRRVGIVVGSVLVAVAVPMIGPFMGLIGALCFSVLGIMLPAVIETIIYWESPSCIPYNHDPKMYNLSADYSPKPGHGLGCFKWILWKNILLLIVGLMGAILGTYTSLLDIVEQYSLKPVPLASDVPLQSLDQCYS